MSFTLRRLPVSANNRPSTDDVRRADLFHVKRGRTLRAGFSAALLPHWFVAMRQHVVQIWLRQNLFALYQRLVRMLGGVFCFISLLLGRIDKRRAVQNAIANHI